MFWMHCGNRNKHSPTTVTHCLVTNNNTNFEIQNNMPSLQEQQREMNWMFALLLDELYDIMDELSYIKWELANRQNPTVNDDLIFDPFRTIGRFWKLHCQLYCFSSYFTLMSLQLSLLELARLVIMPGVTDKMARIFQNQPLFILGLQYFTYTSQHIDRLEREVEQARCKQAFLFNRIVEDGFEQKIRPLIIRNCWWLICYYSFLPLRWIWRTAFHSIIASDWQDCMLNHSPATSTTESHPYSIHSLLLSYNSLQLVL